MSNPRPLAFALGLVLAASLTALPPADAAKKRKSARPAVSLACSDFYAHANADWLGAHDAVAGSGLQSALGELGERARQQQIALLDDYMRNAQAGVPQLLGDFWASGLDEAAVERDGAAPIAPLLARIAAIRRGKDVPAAVAALHQAGIPALFDFGADVDLADPERHIGYFGQGGLGLPDPAYYTRSDADTRALLGRYTDYVSRILALTGSQPERLQADTRAVLDLETRIAQASAPQSASRDPRDRYAPVPVAGLGKQYRHLQLDRFLQAQGVSDDRVSLADPQLFAQLDALVAGLKPEQWKAYLRYQVGAAMAPYLSRAWREADFAFRGTVLRGQAAPAPRQQQVLDAINLVAGPMLGREYVGRYLPDATRTRAAEIAAQVRDALGRGIERNDWMSPAAKAEAAAKLARLKIEVGAPARELDYTVQPMNRGSFGGNMLIASTWRHREEMKRIGRGNADRRWNVLPQQPALAYDLGQNRLLVTAAMLQPPVLDMTRDAAAHYGAFGALVGHELTHGFDGSGRHVDAAGTVRDWWTPADLATWDARLAALATQYGAYPYPQLKGTSVGGGQTRQENAADLGGLELAWDALANAQPALADAGRQAFFLGWAQLWPQRMSADVATRLAATEVHAPGQWRSNGPLADLPAFGAAFACKAGTPMQRESAQQVRIWR
ncbi:M13 family metallopeptidase [Cognatiluteimonas weifangensis]|uniref:M13 family peptidase n=1 Tax=Cognatiluteimonas weifangensis TaxID=2303539 RepID=A0A372DRV9_9GAMM|nr:M13 family metallopeptidase [Luteimonas weifangensis]RFP62310.1 M13 family peptidase [Luteimonas weifangensis]